MAPPSVWNGHVKNLKIIPNTFIDHLSLTWVLAVYEIQQYRLASLLLITFLFQFQIGHSSKGSLKCLQFYGSFLTKNSIRPYLGLLDDGVEAFEVWHITDGLVRIVQPGLHHLEANDFHVVFRKGSIFSLSGMWLSFLYPSICIVNSQTTK